MGLRQVDYEDGNWMGLIQDHVKWRAGVLKYDKK
jgi:hypothetical protein